ncbi:FadR/GntR family transcriptional regulator [Nocardioides ginsengisoli]|uniref:FadR/GntR family transcriptional regulator n=1 Tax=Nocardioides ginsengisoli TaxID=363868 RepID=A0ABW3VT23_9ACTN
MAVPGGKAARVIAGQIVRDITDESLARLPAEAELLKRYQVSRPSLREGMRLLEMYGVITLKPGPGGGAIVNQVASREFASTSSLYYNILGLTLRDLMQTRLHLEPLMARLAAERVKDGTSWDSAEDDAELDTQTARSNFHLAVARFAGDPILVLFAHALRDITLDVLHRERLPSVAGPELGISHDQIEEAIRNGQPMKSESLMREHVQAYLDYIQQNAPHLLNQVIDWA